MSFSILGTGSALPSHCVTNDELATFLDTSDEWIRTRTGIRQRHLLQGNETVTSLAVTAAHKALHSAGIDASELDFIISPTIGGDFITPSLSSVVQAELGASCPAMDLNAACSGFLYGLEAAAGMFARGSVQHVLVVAAEGLSRIVDWADRSTCVLFGDGAGAVVLGEGDNYLYSRLTCQGWSDPLNLPFPSGNRPDVTDTSAHYLNMNGAEIYKFAVNAVFDGVNTALEKTGLSVDDIDHVLLHQANLRIIEAAKKKLGIPEERYPTNLANVGNVSSASIPILMDGCHREGRFAPGDILMLSGFGGGLTTGTAIIRWAV